MRNKSILTKAMRRLMLMVLLVTQVLIGTSSAFADTVAGSVTFDSSVWGTTNKQFDNGSTQTWTNYLTLTLNAASSGDNCRISGGYLGLYHQSTLEITAPVGCTITGMTIAGSNYGGTPSTTPGSLTSEPGSTSYTWTGSSSSVTISTDAGERDSYDFQSIVVTYETSLDAMATTTSNGAIYSFNQNPNPFFGVSLYAKTITAGNQEMYFDAFGSDDPMIMQNLVDSSFYLHMPAQSRLRLQRSDSSSDIYVTKAEFTFVSGSPSISPDGGTYNSSTHTWTGQESQIIFLFNEEADIQLIESEAGLVTASNHTVNITCGEYGTISGKVLDFTGTSTEDFQVASGAVMPVSVPDGYSVELTFVPAEGYYLSSVMRDDVEDIVSFVEDGKITLTSITSNMSLTTTFTRMQLLLQIDSQTEYGAVNWQVTDVLAGDVITNGMVKNAVDDIPVPYGSTVKLTFAYDQTQYGLSQLTRNGADILTEVSENSYTITNYATNDTIAVDFVQLVSEPYAVLANKTLTFYYDKNKTERNGMTVERFNSANMRPWHVSRDSITTVTFDASFADYRPTATAFWFNEFSALKTVNGLDNLNTSEVTYMDAMFGYCSNLKTIYINNNWDLSKVTSSTSMFNGCTNLVGGQWTNYMSSMTTATYARIDGGTTAPGYFTSWADTAAVAPVTASRNMYELMLTCPTPNVAIMYAVLPDGTPSTVGVNYTAYSEPITLDSDCTVLFYAERPSGIRSIYSDYTFKMTDVQTVDSPVFSWNADNLTMSTPTEGASVYYTLTDGTSMGTETLYTAPVEIKQDVIITAVARMTGLNDSEPTVLDYPYTAWTGLLTAIADAQNVLGAAAGNDNVTAEQRDSLVNFINTAQGMYEARIDSAAAITQFTTGLTTLTETVRQAVEAVAEPYAVLSDNGTFVDPETGDEYTTAKTLTFYYDKKKQERNGMSVGPFENTSPNRGWHDYISSIISVVFDSSFANFTELTSTDVWFSGFNNLTTISGMENLHTSNVTSMYAMFRNCSSLTNIDLSSFNTSNVSDFHRMFQGCTSLANIDLSNFNTSKAIAMGNMFRECSSLTNLDLSNFDTSEVGDMNSMFSGCTNLSEINVSSFNVSKVETMGGMFAGCNNLKTLDLSSFNLQVTNYMTYMFKECYKLETIYVSDNWNLDSLKSASYGSQMFTDCTTLVGGRGTVYDADHDNYTYAHIDYGASNPGYFTPKNGYVAEPVFAWNADELTITSGTDGATIYYTLTDAVTSTPTLTQYTSPITVTSDVLIEAYAEKDSMARSMSTVLDYPYTAWMGLVSAIADAQNVLGAAAGNDNVTAEQRDALMNFINTAQGMYEARVDSASAITQFTTDLTTMTETVRQAVEAVAEPYAVLSEGNTTLTFYYDSQKESRGGMSVGPFETWSESGWDNVRQSIKTVVFDSSFANCTSITSTAYWFYNCLSLTSIINIQNLKTDNVTDMRNMFWDCAALTSLDVSHFNTGNVTNMSNMFYLCEALTNIDVSNFNTDNVTDMHNMFYSCKVLTSLDLSGFNTLNVTNMSGMFGSCWALATLDVSGFKTDNVTDMSGMFTDCSHLTSLDVSGFKTDCVTSMGAMFEGCSRLTTIDVSGFKTDKVTSMFRMFYSCTEVTNLDVSGFKTDSVTRIAHMFRGCSALTSLDVSGFNTDNVTDMQYMFYGCIGLSTLDLSSFNTSKVQNMNQMFRACSGLTTIYVSGLWSTAVVTNGADMFRGCSALVGGAGTTYNVNHVDYSYAHLDGGPSNPGYFTLPLAMGDANGDGNVNIADAVATVTNILGQPTEENFYKYAADMNGDSEIDIFDVTLIVNAALNAPAPGRRGVTRSGTDEVPAESIQLTADAHNVYMEIDHAQQYTALQFDMDLPEGTDLLGVRLLGDTDHQLSFVKRGDSQYRVIALSMNNEVFRSANGHLIQLQVSNAAGEGDVKMSDVLFVKPSGKTVTGIGECLNTTVAKDDSIYNLQGEKLGKSKQQLGKGIYIINHKKVIIK